MDEYAEYVYQRRPEYRHLSAGDMTAQKELRNHLSCKSFKWFMSEVAWDLPKHYPPVEPPAAAWGEARISLGNYSVGELGPRYMLIHRLHAKENVQRNIHRLRNVVHSSMGAHRQQ